MFRARKPAPSSALRFCFTPVGPPTPAPRLRSRTHPLRPRRFLLAGLVAALPSLAPAQTPDLYDIDVIRDIRLTFAQSNWWQLLLQNYQPEINIPADMVVDNVTYRGVGVRFRDNTSYTQLQPGSEKQSFNMGSWSQTPSLPFAMLRRSQQRFMEHAG